MGKMFQDDLGNTSSLRMMNFVSLLAAITFGLLCMQTKNPDGITLSAMFLVGAFAPKVVQKFAERVPGNKVI